MKKALSLLFLAALTIGLLGSCSKINERIDGVEKRVESIENEKIASIENQIAAINSSIADLGQIRSDISSLKQSAENHGQDISELQKADETLKNRIDNLEDYLDGTLTKFAEKDWAIATFATLEQLDSTKKDLSTLEGKVSKLGETFDGKLSDLKTELTNSINTAVSSLETRISTLEARVSALERMIQSVSITPTYSDGSVEAVDSILTLKCIVNPAEALIGMKSLKDSLVLYADSVKVKTKAGTSAYMEIKVSEATVTDAAQGAITLKADISEYLPKGEDKALTVALHIKNGISDFTTEFVVVDNTPPGYTVTFNNNYGTSPVTRDTSVLKSGKINKPSDPTRDGYFFDKWFTKKATGEKDVDWDFETMTVSQDTTLYAEWIQGLKVKFRMDISNPGVFKDTLVRMDTKVNKPAVDPDSTGYAFKGWFTRKADGTFGDEWNFNTNVTKDTTLYAKWAKTSMTIAELVATNSKFPVSNSDDVIPENVWLNASNDSCYFVKGQHIRFLNRTKSSLAISYTPSLELIRQGDGSYQNGQGTLTFVMDCDSVVSVTLNNATTTYNGEYTPQPLPAGALSGEFSVSATKKVHFSQGNLVATINASGTPTAWKFAANQYDYLGEGGANKTIGKSKGDVDLFGWSTASTTYGLETSGNIYDTGGNFVDWGKNIGDGNTWRTLSKDEWTYLFNTRTASTVSGTENARYAKATVNSKAGVILLPDTYAHPEGVTALTSINTKAAAFTANTYDLTDWAKIESAGAVFLPAAGLRKTATGLDDVGVIGYYWSSTLKDNGRAHYVSFKSDDVSPDSSDFRKRGRSVRLVTDVK